jgi:hypothetical protein
LPGPVIVPNDSISNTKIEILKDTPVEKVDW